MPKTRTSFKPGQSGNPNGRPPKGYSITEWFKSMFSANPEVKDEIANSIVRQAKRGDIQAQKLIWNYLDGMPPQNLNIGGQEGNQLKIVIEDYASKHSPATETKTGTKKE